MNKFSKKQKYIFIVIGVLILLIPAIIYAVGIRMQASGCTSVEEYDSLRGQCYYDCNDDKECAEKASKVDAELNAFFSGSQTKTAKQKSPQQAIKAPSASNVATITKEFTGTETNGTVYTVQNDLTLAPTPNDEDQKLWDLFTRVAGANDTGNYVQSFEVFNDDQNDTAASVWQSQTPSKWHVNVNAAYKDNRKDLVHTMVHEYGQILSLNNTQVGSVSGSCPRLSLSEGCSNEQSYINNFYTKYWQKYGDEVPSNEGENQDEVQEFYDAHKSSFVTDYAASNITEDFAESWAVFVTSAKPSGNEEKDQKIRFFYDNPVLVAQRNEIRVNIAKDIQ